MQGSGFPRRRETDVGMAAAIPAAVHVQAVPIEVAHDHVVVDRVLVDAAHGAVRQQSCAGREREDDEERGDAASAAPIWKLTSVPTLPNKAAVSSSSWPRYGLATVRANRYLRASDRIVAKEPGAGSGSYPMNSFASPTFAFPTRTNLTCSLASY